MIEMIIKSLAPILLGIAIVTIYYLLGVYAFHVEFTKAEQFILGIIASGQAWFLINKD